MRYLQYVKTDDTGRCWWDTGIIPDLNTKVELSIRPTVQTSVSSSYCCQGYLGSQRGDDTPDSFQVRLYGWDWQGLWFRIGTTQVDYQPHSELFDTWINITLDKDNYTVNGNSYSVGASYMEENVRSLYIGGINNPNWNHKRAAFGTMFGEVKIWKSGVLVFDGIPAEDNGALGFYDEVSQTFKSNLGTGVPVAGPDATSIVVVPSKTRLANTGETISIEVSTENAWTVTGNTWLTLSSTGDTGGTTITATAPSYSGVTNRTDILTFIDSVTSDEASITISQKKYQSGQPFYLGGDEVTDCYVGGNAVVEAYLGEDLVYSSGPFQGIKISPTTINFNSGSLLKTCKVKSSESWTMTVPAWVTASTLTGDTGETVVSLSTTALTAETSGTIEIVSANYTASANAIYKEYEFLEYIENGPYDGSTVQGFSIDLGVYPSFTTKVQLKGQISDDDGGAYFGAFNYSLGNNNYFRLFTYNNNTLTLDYPTDGLRRITLNGITFGEPFEVEVGNCYIKNLKNSNTVTSSTVSQGNPVQTNFSIPLCCWESKNNPMNLRTGDRFYWIKIWDNDVLVRDLVPAKLGNQVGLYDRVTDHLFTNDLGGQITYGTL